MSVSSALSSASRSVRIGFVLFAVGLGFLVATFVPYFFGDDNRSLWINLGCMLAPAGFVVAVIGVVRDARRDQRAVLQELTDAV